MFELFKVELEWWGSLMLSGIGHNSYLVHAEQF